MTRTLLSGAIFTACVLVAVVAVSDWVSISAACADDPAVLLESRFADSTNDWAATGEATLSEIARVPGHRSLQIRQWSDDQQGSHWLSPVIDNPGKPITISFWAADNYLRCGDFSYSATVDVVEYDTAGSITGGSEYLAQVVWDESRRSEMWGKMLPEGLVWKFYQVTYQPRGEKFRLKFHWPKPLLRGECYLADVRVIAGDTSEASPIAAADEQTASSPLKMEITTPVNGNLFLKETPLRFEVLVYGDSPEAVGGLKDASLQWTVSDFNQRVLATGTTSMREAAPLVDSDFVKSNPGRTRRHHLHLPIVVQDPAARVTGQLLFMEVTLMKGGADVAHQLASFGIVSPRPISTGSTGPSRFSTQWFSDRFSISDPAFQDESIARKTGVSWNQVYDYSWKRVQPTYPGPMDFGKPLEPFPRITFCPNIEQMRTKKSLIAGYVPPECVIPDPLYPGRDTFKIDAYVEYIMAYIRLNRDAIERVVPSGLERSIDARTIELHRKAYAAIKAEWPDLPVGFMLYGLSMNPSSDVDLFLKEKLYEVSDFIDTHCYGSSVDWGEWKRLDRSIKKLRQEPMPLYSTEFARVGGTGQVDRARSMIAAHLDAFANGMEHLYYFNQANENHHMDQPFGRGPTEVPGEQTGGFIYYQNMTWPKVSPLLLSENPGRRWAIGNWSHVFGGSSLLPVLSTMTYYNLVQNYEHAVHRKTVNPTADSVVYVFDREDATVASLWMVAPGARRTCRIQTDLPLVVQDLFGVEQTLAPINGSVLLTVNEWPQTLRVAQANAALAFEMLDPALPIISGSRGQPAIAKLALPDGFAQGDLSLHTQDAVGWLDSTQPVKAGGDVRYDIPSDARMGKHSLTATLRSEDKVVGLLATDLMVRSLVQLSIAGEPLTATQDPAILVTITSHTDQPSAGVVRFTDHWFADGLTPMVREQPYQVAPGQTTVVRMPVPREMVNMTAAYPLTVDLIDQSGFGVSRTDEIHFRGSVRTQTPITVDADLGDWALDELIAVPFERDFSNWGKPRSGLNDCDGMVYSRWDDEHLYFAVVVRDQSPVSRFNDIDMWMDDNIMFGLHPWGWSIGEPLRSGFYREHIGIGADGKSRIFRVGNPQGGPTTSEGCAVAVRYADGQWTYEWAYPLSSIYPMRLQPGAAFRASIFVMDRDEPEPPVGERWAMGGIQLGGFNASINGQPDRWREFRLIDAAPPQDAN